MVSMVSRVSWVIGRMLLCNCLSVLGGDQDVTWLFVCSW